MHPLRVERRSERMERGQVLVIFTIAAVAIIAMVGLVIDGGWTFVQRRDEQNVADSAAMAGGYAYINSNYDPNAAIAAAKSNAATNGYTDGEDGVTVTVTVNASNIVVGVTKPHQNFFSGVIGFSKWDVSTTATVEAGIPNTAQGAMPIIFNQKAINTHGFNSNFAFNEPPNGNVDVPPDANSFNWTVFCTANGNACNANSSQVRALIDGQNTNPQTVSINMAIGPLNAGSHTTLFSSLAAYVGEEFPVAIVDDSGNFLGLAMFRLTGSVGGNTKQVTGYFEGPVSPHAFKIEPGVGPGTNVYGGYAIGLTN